MRNVQPEMFISHFRQVVWPQFLPNQQDDTCAFLSILMELIEVELSPARPFAAILEFGLSVNVKCINATCNQESITKSWSTILPLTMNGGTDLMTLLNGYFAEEHLHQKCSKCGNEQCQRKQNQLVEQPPVFLLMQLLRFAPHQPKINTEILIPYEINMGQFSPTSDATLYRLHAVINHVGFASNFAHYTAIIRNANGSWAVYDDSNVRSYDFNKLVLSQPYILFYKQEVIENGKS